MTFFSLIRPVVFLVMSAGLFSGCKMMIPSAQDAASVEGSGSFLDNDRMTVLWSAATDTDASGQTRSCWYMSQIPIPPKSQDVLGSRTVQLLIKQSVTSDNCLQRTLKADYADQAITCPKSAGPMTADEVIANAKHNARGFFGAMVGLKFIAVIRDCSIGAIQLSTTGAFGVKAGIACVMAGGEFVFLAAMAKKQIGKLTTSARDASSDKDTGLTANQYAVLLGAVSGMGGQNGTCPAPDAVLAKIK